MSVHTGNKFHAYDVQLDYHSIHNFYDYLLIKQFIGHGTTVLFCKQGYSIKKLRQQAISTNNQWITVPLFGNWIDGTAIVF